MSRPPDTVWELSKTLTLCEYKAPESWHYLSGNYGFWLYDKTQEINLSLRAKTERDAFIEALHYYQERLKDVELKYYTLDKKVSNFVFQVAEIED